MVSCGLRLRAQFSSIPQYLTLALSAQDYAIHTFTLVDWSQSRGVVDVLVSIPSDVAGSNGTTADSIGKIAVFHNLGTSGAVSFNATPTVLMEYAAVVELIRLYDENDDGRLDAFLYADDTYYILNVGADLTAVSRVIFESVGKTLDFAVGPMWPQQVSSVTARLLRGKLLSVLFVTWTLLLWWWSYSWYQNLVVCSAVYVYDFNGFSYGSVYCSEAGLSGQYGRFRTANDLITWVSLATSLCGAFCTPSCTPGSSVVGVEHCFL